MSRLLVATQCRLCAATYETRPSRVGGFCSRACAAEWGNNRRWAGQHSLIAVRFWRLVDRRGPDECWPWRGRLSDDGYGLFKAEGTTLLAHRVAQRLTLGVEPSDCVLHSCDNRPCCNPAHHFDGSRGDNNRDRAQKQRSAAKLTADDVRAIRAAASSNVDLAARYGVDPATISLARRAITWAHLQ